MNKEKILHTFCIYSKLSTEQAEEYDLLIELSIKEVQAMLKQDYDLDDFDTLSHYLCGVFAYYRYVMLSQATATDEMRLADITVKSSRSDAVAFAIKIKHDAICLCKEILNDNFLFNKIIG